MDNTENNYSEIHRIFKVLDFASEYPNSNDDISHIIITSMSREELACLSNILALYSPYIIVDENFWNVHKEYLRNERKHKWRNKHKNVDNSSDSDFEMRHHELISNSLEDYIMNKFDRQELYEMLKNLSDKQRRRLILYYFYGYTKAEIAKIENVGRKSIENSINDGLKALRHKGFL